MDTSANKYLETKVLTASPAELRLMLLDGAIKFASQGRDGLAARNFEQMYNGFTRCRAILVELITSAKPEPNRDLYDKMCALYTFMITHLLEASTGKDVGKADRVVQLLEYERQTWALLMEKMAGEQRSPVAAPALAPSKGAAKTAAAYAPATASLSLEG